MLPLLALALGLMTTGCARPGPAGEGQRGSQAPDARLQRTLVTAVRVEPVSLASRPLQDSGQTVRFTTRFFNAELDLVDARDVARPYLAGALPELNSESWRVFPDGRMETTHRLKPNLTWQDGAALSARDFVFASEVYGRADLSPARSRAQALMGDVLAPDDRTIVIRWEGLYPEANMLRDDFQALPRHVLETPFRQDSPDAVAGHPFWTTEYLGLGPYRIERWEPGAQIDAVAFPGHVLGAPRIDRIVIRFVSDENTALTNLLAESVHMVADRAIRDEHAQILNREWSANKKGVVLPLISNVRYVLTQFRPEVVNPSILLDVRVRKALAHSIDKQALSDGLFEGQALVADRFLSPDIPYRGEADRAVTTYPYDPRRSEQLMQEVGYAKDRDGMFVSARGERFNSQVWQLSGAQYEREVAIFVDTWQRAGFDVDAFMLSPAQLRDGRLRASFPGLYIVQGGGSTEARLDFMTAALTPTAANRYNGNNRGGWLSPAYERLWSELNTTLDRTQRNAQAIEMLKLLSDELPAIPTYFNIAPAAHLAMLTGPEMPARVPDPLINWNIHEWDWR